MKKIILLIVPILLGIAAQAQTAGTITIVNDEHCAISVTQLCYDATSCAITATGSSVIVAAGSTATLTTKSCSPDLTAYRVCWATSSCSVLGSCTIVNGSISSSTTPCYPNPALLNNCSGCAASTTGAKISYDNSTSTLTAN